MYLLLPLSISIYTSYFSRKVGGKQSKITINHYFYHHILEWQFELPILITLSYFLSIYLKATH